MKKNKFLAFLLLIAGVVITMTACGGDDAGGGGTPVKPSVTDPVIQNINTSSATVTATAAGDGITECGILYATESGKLPSNGTAVKANSKNISVELTGLTSSTTYYVMTYAKTSSNTIYSSAKSFTTTAAPTPKPTAGKYVGGDISLLPKYEDAGVVYKDKNGNVVDNVIKFFGDEGMNAMRVRLFVDPSKNTDKGACQDLEYVKDLGKRIKTAGMSFMLDFHYSDTWADPSNQWKPDAWKSLSDDELYTKIYDYTKDVLKQLKDAGAAPDFIQTGNEISYGMLWGVSPNKTKYCHVDKANNWDYFTNLLKQASKACREVCPDARIILHTERLDSKNQEHIKFYQKMAEAAVDYDIIGLSYYPPYHGTLTVLKNGINQLVTQFNRDIMIVETGYPYEWKMPGTTYDAQAIGYEYSEEGQRQFTADLIKTLNEISNVKGLFWWWPEDNGNKGVTDNWWNTALYNHDTGQPWAALYELKNFK